MKIYTKTGDSGDTGLYGGPRVRKDHERIEAYGTVDELNAVLGLARCEKLPAELGELLARLQNDLFDIGAELATPDPAGKGVPTTSEAQIEELERAIDHYEAGLSPLKTFILPGGTRAAAALHFARTVCRRAERRLVTLMTADDAHVAPQVLIWLNRLSDLLFVLARWCNAEEAVGDVRWEMRR